MPPRPTPTARQAGPQPRPSIKASASPFDDLTTADTRHGYFLMLYSDSGEGKTTLAAEFERPLFITTAGEQGIHLYRQQGKVPKDTPIIDLPPLFSHSEIPDGTGHPAWERLLTTMERFRDADHGRQTLVIDSTSGLQDICFQHHASLAHHGDMDSPEFCDFYRGYAKAAEIHWSGEFLPLCLQIVAKGYNVILIAHSTFRPVTNPTGPDYEQYRPSLLKTIYDYTKKDLHGIFFLGRETSVTIDQKTKKRKTMGDRRFVGLSPCTWYTAKSWRTPDGMTEIECGESARETYRKLAEALGI